MARRDTSVVCMFSGIRLRKRNMSATIRRRIGADSSISPLNSAPKRKCGSP